MDSLTHAVLGAALGELVLGKRLGNRALAWGALFGTLPDLDALVMPFSIRRTACGGTAGRATRCW